jgi:hypothetical protein
MSSKYHRLISLVILATLELLPNLNAQSSATNSTPPIAATNTNTPIRLISDAQFKKLLADVASTNADTAPTLPTLAKVFGLEHPGQSERHDTFRGPDQHYHTFSQLDNGNFIFGQSDGLAVRNYYVDKNLVLISALLVDKDGVTFIPNKDAQAGLDAELITFAGIADHL